jgi:hypothetical protein
MISGSISHRTRIDADHLRRRNNFSLRFFERRPLLATIAAHRDHVSHHSQPPEMESLDSRGGLLQLVQVMGALEQAFGEVDVGENEVGDPRSERRVWREGVAGSPPSGLVTLRRSHTA